MQVEISPGWDEVVRAKVAEGRYASANQLVEEALELLLERDRRERRDIERMHRAVAIGLEQAERGQTKPWDVEKVRATAHRECVERRRSCARLARRAESRSV